jgi:diguanylate cyclase (GGDEF)-like protein/PAS domain S-box-containing protein
MIKLFRRLPVYSKLLLIFLFTAFTSLLLAGLSLVTLEVGEFQKNSREDLQFLASLIGNRSTAALMFEDKGLAEENLAVLNAQSEVKAACLYDLQENIFVQLPKNSPACPHSVKNQHTRQENTHLYIIEPVIFDQERLGTVYIHADFTAAYLQKLEFIGFLLLVLGAVSLLTFFISIPLLKRIAQPIKKIVDTLRRITDTDDYSLRAAKPKDNDLGILVDAFNKLIAKVNEQNQALVYARDRYLALYNNNPIMVFNLTKNGKILSVNLTGAKQLGLAVNEIQGGLIYTFIHPDDLALMKTFIARCLSNPALVHKQELRTKCSRGRVIWVRANARLVENDHQQRNLLLVCEDVTEARILSEKIAYQASHDALTGLANRSEFDRTIQNAVASARSHNTEYALCYLDLDQFKVVNDTCGHMAGDELLRQLGDLLKNNLRHHDFVARLGGDEFGILMKNCSLSQAFIACEHLRDLIRDFHFAWESRSFTIGVSIGISAITTASGSAVNLLKEADAACYAAKDKGRNRVHVFRPDDEELAIRQGEMQWVEKIQQGLEHNRFCLYGQLISPLGALNDGLHFETLLRYRDEKGHIITPGAFLPAAERYNLAAELDRWTINHVFEWLSQQPEFLKNLALCSINLSGLSLSDESMQAYISRQFSLWQIPSHKICFEITETAAIANLSYAARFISELREQGCLFSLDDFGSGLSSFAYLKNLPVDFIKIDGLFVKDILDDKVDLAMVKSINDVGHVMNKKTIAEFVENEQIFNFLNVLGVDYAQGYGIGKPVPLDKIHLTKPLLAVSP